MKEILLVTWGLVVVLVAFACVTDIAWGVIASLREHRRHD